MEVEKIRTQPEYEDAMSKAYSSHTSIQDKKKLLEQFVEFRNACGIHYGKHEWRLRTDQAIADLSRGITNSEPLYKVLLGQFAAPLVTAVIGGGLLYYFGWN